MEQQRDVQGHDEELAAEYDEDEHWVYGADCIPWTSGRITEALRSSCIIRDDEDERYYSFDYRQIVTEGFRTIRAEEHVRFHVSSESPDRAEFVIRLAQPDPAEYYR
ncbi:hypothetical protein [Streptomyces capitiformicae]|uniref:hypothetical protein n=1 Tax=Streptomyces capitiformicae TaxID=2014920 RepID=UPI001E40866A|nr:hypothetical protein [Streptomyces capitiformicae]